MPELTIAATGQVFTYQPGTTLLELLVQNRVFVDNPCGGKGLCGKCKVRIVSGDAGPICDTERQFLSPEDLQSGIRLACLVSPTTDLTIVPPQNEHQGKVLTQGYVPDFSYAPSVQKKCIEIHRPTLSQQDSLEQQLLSLLQLKQIPTTILAAQTYQPGFYTAVFYQDTLIALETGDTTAALYGVAIDIGTTTVVTALVDLHTGKECASASMVNPQKTYGLDVLTRISYEMEHPKDGAQILQQSIVAGINTMIADVCQQANILPACIYEITVGANCTMMHLLLGIDATSIGKSPYAPIFTQAQTIPAQQIGLSAAPGAMLYCLPAVSSYIGADIVAGAYVCQLRQARHNVLFIDIGTNGEIVLSQQGNLLCCSCAAGPALEGMNISSGMRAAKGAIEDLQLTPTGITYQVIDNAAPTGICGSGILAVVRELLQSGLVLPSGTFLPLDKLPQSDYRRQWLTEIDKKRAFLLCHGPETLLVTQKDIRQVQLAKGAILSGFYALVQQAGITMDQLDEVLIAGQFGAHLPAESLVATGILPEEVRTKLRYVGNTSKTGAYMALMSGAIKAQMEQLATNMAYMELSATKNYERLFSKCLIFPQAAKT